MASGAQTQNVTRCIERWDEILAADSKKNVVILVLSAYSEPHSSIYDIDPLTNSRTRRCLNHSFLF